jgi:hypothetical protein
MIFSQAYTCASDADASNLPPRTLKFPTHSADHKTAVVGNIIGDTICNSMCLASLLILTAAHGPTCAIAAGVGAIGGASIGIANFTYIKVYTFDKSNPPRFDTMVKKIKHVAEKFFKGIAIGGFVVGLNFVVLKYIPVVGFPLAVFLSCMNGFDLGNSLTWHTLSIIDGAIDRLKGQKKHVVTSLSVNIK